MAKISRACKKFEVVKGLEDSDYEKIYRNVENEYFEGVMDCIGNSMKDMTMRVTVLNEEAVAVILDVAQAMGGNGRWPDAIAALILEPEKAIALKEDFKKTLAHRSELRERLS